MRPPAPRTLLCLLAVVLLAATAPHAQTCVLNPVACENALTGDPPSVWDVSGAGDPNLQGFATAMSVNKGETVRFKVDTSSSRFDLTIFRLGFYGGLGARRITTLTGLTGGRQPACLTTASTGLIDCGNWRESASWAVPADAVSGIYLARLTRSGGSDGSHILFVVRDDARPASLVVQTSDTTWQAYNQYGGKSLYTGGPGTNPSRAYKVSYNRPVTTRGTSPEDAFFNAEYPMVRWLEANGYDVSYLSGADTDRIGATELLKHPVFIASGHDEYWTAAQRTNVERARDAGVNLAFFTGNGMFWKARWESSIDGSNTPYRTLVCYKETHANAKIDPLTNVWTGSWRDPRFSPPADGGRPENAVMGTIFTVNWGGSGSESWAIEVPGSFRSQPFWRNTRVATLSANGKATLAAGSLGYEWDENLNNGYRPSGLVTLSSTTKTVAQKLKDYGSTFGSGSATHALTLYRNKANTASVFGAGTAQWSWGLDGEHDRGGSIPDVAMQQATINLLYDMGVDATTLQPGVIAGGPPRGGGSDSPPSVSLTAPQAGAVSGSVTVSAVASDDVGVAGVQFFVDGTALGAEDLVAGYSVTWDSTTVANGTHQLTARARDTAGQLTTSAPVLVTVSNALRTCPCSIWSSSAVPAGVDPESTSIELGLKFRADTNGVVTGIRFYKYSTNTGTHVGNLWSTTGQKLATVTFSGETASGWQQALLTTPVAITAGTVYVVSYHTNVGHYGVTEPGLTTAVSNPPLRALADGESGANGVYKYGAASAYPDQTYHSSNYWVDVVFQTGP